MSPAGPFLPLLPRIESGGARRRLFKKKPSGQRKRWGGVGGDGGGGGEVESCWAIKMTDSSEKCFVGSHIYVK